MATETLSVKITANINDFTSKLNAMEKSLEKTTKQFSGMTKLGDGIQSIGKKITLGLTVPIVGVGVASTKTAIDFESAFAGVKKTVEATDKELATLKQGIRDLAKEMPTTAVEIAGVAEAAGQLGIKVPNILDFTKTMVMLGDSTNMTAEEAATSLARLANITGMSQKDFDKLGSVIVSLGNNLATTEGDITAMGLRLAGAGKQVGMSEAQIMSFAGALSSVGIEAELGGSSFSKVMVNMQLATEKGGKKLEQFASVAGMSASDFKTAFEQDATGAIIAFIKGLGDSENQGKSAIGILDEMGIKEVGLRDTLLRAAGASDVFTEAIELGTKAWEENTALTDEATQRYETLQSKIEILKNKLKDIGIEIGEKLMPYIEDFVEGLGKLCDKFEELSPETQEFIIKAGLILAALGPVIYILGSLIEFVGKVGIAFTVLSPYIAEAGGVTAFLKLGLEGLMGALGSVVGPVIAVALVIGAFALAVIDAYKTNEEFRKKVDKVFSEIKSIITSVMSIVKDVIEIAMMAIKFIWDHGLKEILQFVADVFVSIVGVFTEKLEFILYIVKKVISLIKAVFSGDFKGVESVVRDVLITIVNHFNEKMEKPKEKVKTIIAAIKAIFSGDFKGVESIVNNILQNVVKAFNDKMDSAKEKVNNAISAIKKAFNFSWSLPTLKLPHFSISGGFSLDPPKVPSFGISWYKNGGIMTNPTMFGRSGNTMLGGGEAGPEAILPLNNFYKHLDQKLEDKKNKDIALNLNIENFNNEREQDIKDLVEEIAFYLKRKNIGIG